MWPAVWPAVRVATSVAGSVASSVVSNMASSVASNVAGSMAGSMASSEASGVASSEASRVASSVASGIPLFCDGGCSPSLERRWLLYLPWAPVVAFPRFGSAGLGAGRSYLCLRPRLLRSLSCPPEAPLPLLDALAVSYPSLGRLWSRYCYAWAPVVVRPLLGAGGCYPALLLRWCRPHSWAAVAAIPVLGAGARAS